MMTGLPCPSPSEEGLGMQILQESHDNDGAGDDYDYYHDYDVSMGAAGMVTSIAEVEQVDWWSAAHSAVEPHEISPGFATIPVVQKYSVQLKLADYELLSLRNRLASYQISR